MKIILRASIHITTTVLLCLGFKMGYSQACTSAGPNLVTNGGFELCSPGACTTTPGTTPTRLCGEVPDYSPGYNCVDCDGGGATHQMDAGRYAITSNATDCFNTNWHGAGAGATSHSGNYAMIVDGDGLLTTNLWCQTITVTEQAKYQFIAWLNNPWTNTVDVGSNGPEDIPSIRLTINGTPISGVVATPTVLGGWNQLNCVYTMPGAGSASVPATICIEMVSNGNTTGNDILIDDISFTTISSCPSGTCGYTGVATGLPVNLLSFQAKESGNDALLLWTTTEEDKLSGYVVEKSIDGINFYEIGEVNAASSNYNQVQNYQLVDYHFIETAYFRLKTVDLDGTANYSQIQVVAKNGDKIFISRTEDGTEVRALVNENTNWHIEIFSLMGQELINKTIFLEKGEHLLLNSDTHPGEDSEILRITNEAGEVVYSGMIVW